MTDRFNYLTVALDADIRDDDARSIMDAIQQIRRVISVQGNVANPDDWCARTRIQNEYRRKIWDALEDKR